MPFKPWVPLCGMITVASLLSGCTTHSNSSGGSASGTGDGQKSDKTVIRQMMLVEPSVLDPATAPDIATGQMLAHSFEGLTRFNEKNEIEPCLAEKWELSKDGKTYTFHLRSGVKFHNGREFVADDVKYSWERALAPHTASAQATTYLDGILGMKQVASGSAKELEGVKVVDPHTLLVTLDRPRIYFTGMLTMPQDAVVCKEAVEKTDGKVTTASYIGTGPFKLDSYQPGQQISFNAFADYWDGKPSCDRVEMPVILDKQTAYDNFLTGRIDVFSDMPEARYAQDRDAHKLTAEYHISPATKFAYLGMQENKQPLFKNTNIRRAFGLAVNREEIIKIAFKGVTKLATGILPEGLPCSGPPPPKLEYDPKKAQELLASAGFPGGKGFPALTLTFIQKDPERESEALIIRRNLHDNLGIDVTLLPREAGDFYKAEDKHEMEFYIGGWVADYLDPQDFLSVLYVSTSGTNFVDFKNAEFDSLCNAADATADPVKRGKLYGKANALAIQEMPVVPIYFGPRVSLVSTKLKGWRECLLYTLPNVHTSKN